MAPSCVVLAVIAIVITVIITIVIIMAVVALITVKTKYSEKQPCVVKTSNLLDLRPAPQQVPLA